MGGFDINGVGSIGVVNLSATNINPFTLKGNNIITLPIGHNYEIGTSTHKLTKIWTERLDVAEIIEVPSIVVI